MELIAKSLLPLAFVITLGWFAGRRNIISSQYGSTFATYVMNFSFPCLLFVKTATTKVEDLINYRFIGGFALGLMGMYLLTFALNKYLYKRSLRDSCQSSFVCSFPDMAFMGIPIFMVLFGEHSLISIVVGNIVTSLIMIPLTVSILEMSQQDSVKTNIAQLLFSVFKKPLVISPLVGMLFSWLNISVPSLTIDSLKLIGMTTSGVSLFALGLIMSADRVSFNKFIILNIVKKNIIHPLIMWGIIIWLGISGDWAREAILLCAMPSAIMTTMFAVKYDVLKLESSSSTVLGTAISLATIAVIMRIMGIGG